MCYLRIWLKCILIMLVTLWIMRYTLKNVVLAGSSAGFGPGLVFDGHVSWFVHTRGCLLCSITARVS